MGYQNNTVTISEEDYYRLLRDSEKLNCLEGAGVDNWDGYDLAREMWLECGMDEEFGKF